VKNQNKFYVPETYKEELYPLELIQIEIKNRIKVCHSKLDELKTFITDKPNEKIGNSLSIWGYTHEILILKILEHITNEFNIQGIKFNHLYPSFKILKYFVQNDKTNFSFISQDKFNEMLKPIQNYMKQKNEENYRNIRIQSPLTIYKQNVEMIQIFLNEYDVQKIKNEIINQNSFMKILEK